MSQKDEYRYDHVFILENKRVPTFVDSIEIVFSNISG